MRVLPLPFKVTARAQWEHSSPQPSQLLPDHFQVVPMLVTPNCQAGPAPRAHHRRQGWGRSFWRGLQQGSCREENRQGCDQVQVIVPELQGG